jgi:2-desacetyl-2-hydroxyethyl bacteriochlorophyllide A dehydrogenase
MKAWLLKGYNQALEPIERNRPQPGPGEILLKVKACGLCYTDIKIIKGEIPPPIVTLPHVLGHEVAGEVVEIGQGVSGIRIGDLGVVYSYVTCRECNRCLTGRENICQNLRRVGFELDGGFSEYLSIPAYNFCPFSRDLPIQKMAILADAIGTPYHAITRLAQVKAGQDVLIVGAGGLGLHAVQIAKLCGARALVVDMNPDALALAKTYGADEILPAEGAGAAVSKLTAGQGADAVIEIVGTPETLSWSLPATKSGGKLILVGYAPGRPYALDTMMMHYREYTVMGSRFTTKAELLELIKLVGQGKIRPVVTKTLPFDQANEALEALKKKTYLGRIVLTL